MAPLLPAMHSQVRLPRCKDRGRWHQWPNVLDEKVSATTGTARQRAGQHRAAKAQSSRSGWRTVAFIPVPDQDEGRYRE